MKKIFYILLCLSLILSIGCTRKQEEKEPIEENIQEPFKKEDPIEKTIKNMTLEEKIGQLFIVGFEGKEVDESLEELIEDYKVSGFIFFKRNIGSKNEIINLIDDLNTVNKNNKIPLFISLDEEGGNISRLNHIFERTPTAANIAKIDDIEKSFKHGNEIGKRLLSLGFNLDFAPVLDINTNPKNPVIGNRAFGNTSNSVIKHGIEVMKAIEDTGVIACVKHFPGHGDTFVDSHIGLPKVEKTLEELKKVELLPFNKAIQEDVGMIMIAHILFSEVDGDYPSSMSKPIITDVLRGDLNYKGVIISDDLTMHGITKNYKLEDAVIEFFKAGGDIALIAHKKENYINSIEALKLAVENQEIDIEDIDEKLYRVLSLKEKYFMR